MASSCAGREKAPTTAIESEPAVVMGRQEGPGRCGAGAVGSTCDATLTLPGQVARPIGAEQGDLDGCTTAGVRRFSSGSIPAEGCR